MKTANPWTWTVLATALLAACATSPPAPEEPVAPAMTPEQTRDAIRSDSVRWAMAIMAKIRANWQQPKSRAGFDCTVDVQITPTGEVTAAALRKSCGSEALDTSIVAAVWRASPLPLPANPAVFDPDLSLHFVP